MSYIVHKAVEISALPKSHRLRQSDDYAKLLLESGYIAQYKYDGCNCVVKWDGVSMEVYSRTGQVVTSMPHLREAYAGMPAGVYFGEAWHPELPFAQISGLFRQREAQHGENKLLFIAFDRVSLGEFEEGRSHNQYVYRLASLEDDIEQQQQPSYYLQYVDGPDLLSSRIRDILRRRPEPGYDGLIFREPHGQWRKGDRGVMGEIIKVKPRIRVSCQVVGYTPGKGKYEGLVGNLLVEYKGKTQGAGTGLLDSQRSLEYYTSVWDGAIVELEALGHTDAGLLREPVLLGIRSDVITPD